MGKTARDINPKLRYELPCDGEKTNDPVGWFTLRYPEAAERYGPPFMVGSWTDPYGDTHIIPAHLNVDFMASLLGGDRRLGHQKVYHGQEDRFYFFDPMVDAFCPTSEEKLQLLLSSYLVKCAGACGRLVDVRPLVETFRSPKILNQVISRAKALLEADSSFFIGEQGHRRYVDGRYIEPTELPSYRQFVKKALVACPDGRVTLPDAFHQYFRFCADNQMQPLTRSEFRHLVGEVIREEFKVGLRHDVPGSSGKSNHGWVGIQCREEWIGES